MGKSDDGAGNIMVAGDQSGGGEESNKRERAEIFPSHSWFL